MHLIPHMSAYTVIYLIIGTGHARNAFFSLIMNHRTINSNQTHSVCCVCAEIALMQIETFSARWSSSCISGTSSPPNPPRENNMPVELHPVHNIHLFFSNLCKHIFLSQGSMKIIRERVYTDPQLQDCKL